MLTIWGQPDLEKGINKYERLNTFGLEYTSFQNITLDA